MILLSEAYSGLEVTRCYAIDPTTGKNIDLSVHLNFTRADMADIFDYKHCDLKDTIRAASEVLGLGMERKRKRDWDHAVREAIRYGWDNCGAKPGEILTDEHRKKIAQLAGQMLRAYVANLLRPRPAPSSIPPETGLAG